MKIYFYFILVLFIGLSSCKKLNKLTQFDIEFDSNFVIPSSTGINLPTSILTPDFPTNSESKFAVEDTRKDLIESISLKEMTLSVTSPSNGNFNFLKTIRIYIKAEGLDEVLIAYKENMGNTNSKSISLDLNCQNLREYIVKDEMDVRVETITDEVLSPDHEVNMHSVYFVDASLIK